MLRTREINPWSWRFLLGIVSLCAVLVSFGFVKAQAEPKLPSGLKAVPQPVAMPPFQLPTTHGDTLDSATLAGRVVIVRFWATW